MAKSKFKAKKSTIIKELVSVMKQMKASNLKITEGDLLNDEDTEIKINFDRGGKRYVFKCDNYETKLDNFRASQLSICYLFRALESYGVSSTESDLFNKVFDNFFIGFEATPDDSVLLLGNSTEWYEILGLEKNATREEIISSYKSLARIHHPDMGGNNEQFCKLRKAYEEGIEKQG